MHCTASERLAEAGVANGEVHRGGFSRLGDTQRCPQSVQVRPAVIGSRCDVGQSVSGRDYEIERVTSAASKLIRRLQCHPPVLGFEEGDGEGIYLAEFEFCAQVLLAPDFGDVYEARHDLLYRSERAG